MSRGKDLGGMLIIANGLQLLTAHSTKGALSSFSVLRLQFLESYLALIISQLASV